MATVGTQRYLPRIPFSPPFLFPPWLHRKAHNSLSDRAEWAHLLRSVSAWTLLEVGPLTPGLWWLMLSTSSQRLPPSEVQRLCNPGPRAALHGSPYKPPREGTGRLREDRGKKTGQGKDRGGKKESAFSVSLALLWYLVI